MGYEILTNADKTSLENVVKSYLAEGWKCQGGVSITTNVVDNSPYYAQAVIK